MREGLRSGKQLVNQGKDKVSPRKIVENEVKVKVSPRKTAENEMEETGSGSGLDGEGEENPHLVSGDVETERESVVVEIEESKVVLVKEECVEDGEVGEREGVGLVKNGRKRRRAIGGEESKLGGVMKKKVKEEEDSDCKVQIGVRVLRSRSVGKIQGDEEGDKGEAEGGFVGKGGQSDGCEKEKVKVEKEESDQPVVGVRKRKLKKKRGRPPMVKKDEVDLRVGRIRTNLKRKRGRPPKAENEEGDQAVRRLRKKLKRGRGRPPKLEESNESMKAEPRKEGRVGGSKKGEKGLKLRHRWKRNASTDSSRLEKRIIEKELNARRFSPSKKNTRGKDLENEDKASLEPKSDMVNASSTRRTIREGGKAKQDDGISTEKQLVREKITKLLFSAGWTVEYRPRNTKEYLDAVYISPDGKTHWSVTLAYRVLKERYEAGNGESKTYKAGFIFTPIPDEEFSMLKRIVSKTRVDKNKRKKKHKGGNKTGVVEKKRHKEKQNSVLSPGSKSMKGKGKSLLCEQDYSDGTSQDVMQVSVRDHKRRKTQNKKRCALLVRNTMEGVDSDVNGYIPYNGKRSVLSWMIDLGTVPLNGKVQYMNQRRKSVKFEGRITRDGIHCDCCSDIIPISKFEDHAGSKLCQPFQNIFLETGNSLLQCLLDSWNKQKESEREGFHFINVDGEDPNDDTCGICGDGGDLICCDGCPSTFHQSCLDIKKFPSGDWHCVYCSCKFCGMVGGNMRQRDDADDVAISALLTCRLCEEKFHQPCIQVKDAINVDYNSLSFCGKKCQELFDRLKMLLGVKHELEEGFSWTLIQRSDVGSDISPSEIHSEVEWNSKLAVSFFIMDECFLPVVDHRSGVNLIQKIIYNCGSNFTRLNYSGFFTAILERGDEIISAASIRIHGNQLAEMPFIGTRHMYRRQGMCRRLLSAIESALCSLNVEKLVIPAISERKDMWTSIFGFKPLELSSKKNMRNMNMLVFPGIDMLQKPLSKCEFAEDNTNSAQGLMSTELVPARNSDVRCSAGFDLNVSSEACAPHASDTNDEPAVLESALQLPDGSLNDTSDITTDTIDLPKCVTDMHCQAQLCVIQNNLEESKTVVKQLDSVCDANVPNGEVREYQIAASGSIIPTSDEKTMELDSQSDCNCISEVESKTFMVSIGSESTDCGKGFVSASGEDTENVDCEMKIEDSTVEQRVNSGGEDSICHSDGLKVSGENVVSHDLDATSQMSIDARDTKHHGSQQLQVMGCVLELDERMLDTQEGNNSHAAAQDVSGSQITSNISSDVALPTYPSVNQKEQNVVNGFPVDCSVSPSCQGNGLDSNGADVTATVEGSCQFSCEASINPTMKRNFPACMSNGVCMSTEVTVGSCEVNVDGIHEEKEASNVAQTISDSTDQDVILDRPEVNNKSLNQFESGSQFDHIGVTQCNSKSSEQSESDLQNDHASVTHCSSESMCNLNNASDVALHCASSGGNSRGTPEVFVLSNQAS
ncbi:uncharacterized protein LOC126710220 isoform X2 [Quercus robur]|uniref:uncharacterized protein LOC126710220 isoform X2 n=1 Tax=Quercus robur TaxID=38942 RepID=UPI00216210FE|nr:uncharacterized protein LOC126710220 isoform X2 [Quercus robur]